MRRSPKNDKGDREKGGVWPAPPAREMIKCYLFDLDGTVYLGGRLIPGAKETLARLAKTSKVCFLTNNSSKSKAEYLQKLHSLGLDCDERHLISSLDSAVRFLQKSGRTQKVFALATPGVKAELAERGIELVEEGAETVLATYDTAMTYQSLTNCCLQLRVGAFFCATHPDLNCPSERGPLPDLGSLFALIEASTGRKPDVVCGKPFPLMAETVRERFGLDPAEIAMVGDRLTTDIPFGLENGFFTVLVLTGESDRAMLEASGLRPHAVLESLNEL